ncbi:carotenoid biosynthesis protein [Terriglobus albidus]|uniref:Carotenoid biosynthesis protein n=1 Tax=Terriglobus albidus TaxID=1592106 RepID=A0A5B9EIW7_9BACT|nr:carotenoid biosynthesis protein [Terriglobus albidus]QEE30341.1 carotenoid biosynthesis protein [Terriglobus albidus]
MPVNRPKNDQNRLLLWGLLLLYLIGRTLQLFAGRVPNLILVIFHVVPPALFAVVHGARVYRSRGVLVFTCLSLGVGALFESVSLRTGFPFGHYRFTGLMGPKIFDLPILLALAYVGMGYLSWVVSVALAGGENRSLSGGRIVWTPMIASFVMTTWDLSMEAIWADVDHGWVWRDGGSYYGVPTSNFLGWLLTTYVFYQLFAFYLRNQKTLPARRNHYLPAILFYALSALGNLLVIAPSSLGNVFVDATGKQWMISSILHTSRLVSIFLMAPLSLVACVSLYISGRPRNADCC